MPKQWIKTARLGDASRARLLERYLAAALVPEDRGLSQGPLWLAPNALAAEEARDSVASALSAKHAGRALLSPRIGTFDAHAQRLLLLAGATVRLLAPFQRSELLRLAITQVQSSQELPYFGRVAQTDGVVRLVGQAIAEMKRCDLWAETFAEEAAGPRDRELALFYSMYQRMLVRNGLFDREGCFWAARAALRDRPELAGRPTLAIVEGFTDFTPAQLEILGVLASRCDEMVIALPVAAGDGSDPSRSALTARGHATVESLRRVLPEAIVEPEPAAENDHFTRRVAERLYAAPTDRNDRDGEAPPAIRIIAAGNEQTEFETVCDRVKGSLVAGTTQPDDVLIVLRAGPDGWDRLRCTLQDFGLPAWLEKRPTYATTPAARLVDSLLTVVAEDWPAAAVQTVVCHSAVTVPIDTPVEPRTLEELLRKMVFASGRESLLRSADRLAETAEPAAVAAAGLSWLSDELQSWPDRALLGVWLTVLDETLNRLGAVGDPLFSESWSGLRRLLAAASDVRALVDDSGQVNPTELRDVFRRCCAEEIRREAATPAGRLRVVTPETARGLTAADVYVLSVGEGNYPRVDGAGAIEQPDPGLEVSDEMHLFLALASKPRGKLTLSYTALDDKAQPRSPSPYLAELRGCFPDQEIPTEEVGLTGKPELPDAPHGRRLQRLGAVSAALEGDAAPLAGLLGSPVASPTARNLVSAVRTILDRAQPDQFGTCEGLLSGKGARANLADRFGTQHLWSASRLEQYAACPFRFFAEHVLKISPPPSATPETDPRRRGSLLHDLLAALLRQAAGDPASVDWERALEGLIAEAAGRFDRYGVESGLRAVEAQEIGEWVPRIASQAAAYEKMWQGLDQTPKPTALEVRFGPSRAGADRSGDDPRSTDEPFALRAGEHTVLLTGQIDRVDLAKAGGHPALVVIDYKSNDAKFDPAQAEAGRQLQLPLYALAAETLLFSDQGAQALAAGYWPLRSEGKGFADNRANLRLREATAEGLSVAAEWERLQAAIAERVGQIVEGVRRGDFPVYNTDEHCTSWCDFRTVCRVGQVRSLNKAWPPTESPQPTVENTPSAEAADADR
ncbi:MAG: PD-(D/E)XK nuclease family protein [Planctomycetota bacterium]